MTTTATAATTEPAAEISGSQALAGLTASEREAWQRTGEWPEPKPAAEPQPAAEAEDEDEDEDGPAPQGEQKPAPKAGEQPKAGEKAGQQAKQPEKPVSKRQQQINDLIRQRTEADQRAAALERQIAEIQAQITGRRGPETPQDAIAATQAGKTQPPAAEQWKETRPRPKVADFETYEEYEDARDGWNREQWESKQRFDTEQRQRVEREQAAAREFDEKAAKWIQRCDALKAESQADFEKVQTFLGRVQLGTPLSEALLGSEVGPRMALHLAENPAEADRIARLHPFRQAIELGGLEVTIKGSQQASAPASAVQAATKTVSTAPAPPVTLGQRPADTADPEQAAVASGDFRAYAAAANQREIARRK